MVDMTDLKSVEHKSLVWVRLPPLVRSFINLKIFAGVAERCCTMVVNIKTYRNSREVVYPKWTSCRYPTLPPAPFWTCSSDG